MQLYHEKELEICAQVHLIATSMMMVMMIMMIMIIMIVMMMMIMMMLKMSVVIEIFYILN
jgi:hypothetical protein